MGRWERSCLHFSNIDAIIASWMYSPVSTQTGGWNATASRLHVLSMVFEKGMQTMPVLGRNMAWLLKSIEAGKDVGIALPETKERCMINFIKEKELIRAGAIQGL